MTSHLVSICIPCFNASNYIAQTINCLLEQTYPLIEIIIVDDHSTDNSLSIINQFSDDRIKKLVSKSKGAASARNEAFNHSNGSYIIFLDADDYIPINFVESQMKCLNGSTTEVCVSNWGRFYNNDIHTFIEDSNILKKDLTFKEWIEFYWPSITHMTVPGRIIIPRKILNKSGLWNETLSLNDDFDFYCRVFKEIQLIKYNDEVKFKYRSGISGLSTRKNEFTYQLSNFNSLESGIKIALKTYPYQQAINIGCANLWQNFIFECYPKHQILTNRALNMVNALGGSNLKFPAGGYTKLLINLLGWRLTKRIKFIIEKFKS